MLSVGFMTLFLTIARKGLARGCESYYRVTGAIAGCSDISTEDARKLWIEKYSICLDIQLSEEISAYKGKMARYYANRSERDSQQTTLDNLSLLENSPELPSSISLRELTDYEGDTSFCNR